MCKREVVNHTWRRRDKCNDEYKRETNYKGKRGNCEKKGLSTIFEFQPTQKGD